MQNGEHLIGRVVDVYRIQKILGRGGMGIVYQAEDLSLDRPVAMKVMDPGLAQDESFLRRFRSEAHALARLNSPYIVHIHAFRQTDEGSFIIMEYVPGGTLKDRMQQGRIPWNDVLPLTTQILHALSDAHGVGIVHRDIKPGNIMLTSKGGVKVTDFGLAKVSARDAARTVTQSATGSVAGSLNYMSPEQVKGARDLDHRSDLYSLGVTMYEMLSDHLPFGHREGDYAVRRAIVEETPRPPSFYVPDIPAALDRVVMKALEKDPDDRFQSAGEMLDALGRISMPTDPDATVVFSPSESSGGHRTEETGSTGGDRRRFAWAWALGIVGLLGIVVFVVADHQTDSPLPMLSIATDPAGAIAYVNGEVVGPTPIDDYEVAGESLNLRLVKSGFVPIDTTLRRVDGRWPALTNISLSPTAVEPGYARLQIDSRPPDATVWIDGQRVGSTPHMDSLLNPGRKAIRVEKEGFEGWRIDQDVEAGEQYVLFAPLNPEETPVGTMTLRAESDGALHLDGQVVQAGSHRIAAGRHDVACGEAPYRADTSVVVQEGATTALTCYFETTVSVGVTGGDTGWGTVWINDVNSGEQTPVEFDLAPGTYRIHVRRQGFETIDDEDTLVVVPTFAPRTVAMSFELRSRY